MALIDRAPGPGPSAHSPVFTGEFETHLTVPDRPGELPALAAWSAARGLELTHIVLARGRTPSQPMLTLRGSGTLEHQQVAADALARELRQAGWPPVRVKIEATPWTLGVPEHDRDAAALGPGYYFEHHLKVRLTPGADLPALTALALAHDAHLSWNARRVERDGRSQRFVTQRCHGVGLRTAGERLDRLVGALGASAADSHGCLELISVEREFVVLDSNLGIDDGWLDDDHRDPRGHEPSSHGSDHDHDHDHNDHDTADRHPTTAKAAR
ncbi:hypothetical protein GCM10009665_64620 [Kitasatospora nipponensis]|uniref:Ankyrin n=1 Tax=Kitasatospora nipponensis TaxID=258049 RepID=A0ABP4HHL2_9ACTN